MKCASFACVHARRLPRTTTPTTTVVTILEMVFKYQKQAIWSACQRACAITHQRLAERTGAVACFTQNPAHIPASGPSS